MHVRGGGDRYSQEGGEGGAGGDWHEEGEKHGSVGDRHGGGGSPPWQHGGGCGAGISSELYSAHGPCIVQCTWHMGVL